MSNENFFHGFRVGVCDAFASPVATIHGPFGASIEMKLRFTVRDMLWLLALVAVCVGWMIDHNRPRRFEVYDVHDLILVDMLEGEVWVHKDKDDTWVRSPEHERHER